MIAFIKRFGLVALTMLCTSFAKADSALPYAKTPQGKAFIEAFSNQLGYSKRELTMLLNAVYRDEDILKKIAHPAEKTTPWFKYRRLFLDGKRITNGVKFYKTHQRVLKEAYDKYGVSPFIITAIIGVETRYGKLMGNDLVIRALATIGFDYPKRSEFFIKELKAFLRIIAEENFNPFRVKGSYAGAMGMTQFMPSSYLHYAVDYEGDGKRDLWSNPNDAIFSVANYLAQHGWEKDGHIAIHTVISLGNDTILQKHRPHSTIRHLKSQGLTLADSSIDDNTLASYLELTGKRSMISFITFKNFDVITRYNNSPLYAMAVKELANAIEKNNYYE